MKKQLVVLITGIMGMMMGSMPNAICAETVRMGYFEIKPHMYQDSKTGKPAGASIRYFESIAKEMGYDVEWTEPLPFPRLIYYLQEGTVDGSLVITKNPEREEFLHYPERAYHSIQTVFVLRKDNKLGKIESIADVRGYRVGFLQGGNLTEFVRENMDKLKMEFIPGSNWTKSNLLKLINGRLDAVYDLNESTMLYEAKILGIQDQIKIIPLPEPPGHLFAVFSKKSEKGQTLAEKYTRVAAESGLQYKDLLDREFREVE